MSSTLPSFHDLLLSPLLLVSIHPTLIHTLNSPTLSSSTLPSWYHYFIAGKFGRVHVRNLSGTVIAVEARQLAALAAHSNAVEEFEDAEADMLDLLAMLAGDDTGEGRTRQCISYQSTITA